ncbi:Gustatory receptor [Sergentomyia squamirostris]
MGIELSAIGGSKGKMAKNQKNSAWSGKFTRKTTNPKNIKTIRFLTPVVNSSSVEHLGKRPIETFSKNLPETISYNLPKERVWDYEGSFMEAMRNILVLGQCFGLMPVINITSKIPGELRFSWLSLRTLYSLVCLLGTGIYTGLTICHSLSSKIEFVRVVPIIFYSSNLFIIYAFIGLAQNWPSLMETWKNAEMIHPIYQTAKEKRFLKRKICTVTSVLLILSLIEHVLSLGTMLHFAHVCPDKENQSPLEALFKQEFTQMFAYTHYSLEKGILGQILNSINTFVWSFMDCFVIIVSIGLSTGFKNVNKDLIAVKGKVVSEEFWQKQRSAYRRMCDLCDSVDSHISRITLVSFSNNLFFICVQLLNSLNKKDSFIHTFYFWFSLLFLIARTLAVSLYAATINEESKEPIHVFRVVPRESWCLEVKRFYEEVTNDTVALSGMKFFYLTRRLVLSVAGTIVTYELVLLQFHQDEELEKDDPCKPLAIA